MEESVVDLDKLKSGDVVLFSGKGFISRLIQLGTLSKYSHVGLVVRKGGDLYLWESTTLSDIPDVESGEYVKGVQMVSLKERLITYDGGVAIRRLKLPLTTAQEAAYEAFREEVKGRPYEKSNVALVRSAVDILSGQKEDLSSLFCSEMDAEAYQRMELVNEDKSSSEYTPADFAKKMKHILGKVVVVK